MTIFGTAGDDLNVQGTAGNDVIDLLAGNDNGFGLGGNDQIFGGAGNDQLIGNDGNDLLVAGAGAFDFLGGDTGADTLDGTASSFAIGLWTSSPQGINLDAGAGTAQDGFGFTDSFSGIDQFFGSIHADSMVGGQALTSVVQFFGGLGNDTFGGSGFNLDPFGLVQVTYNGRSSGAMIDLQAGTAQIGAEVDTLTNIRRVDGTGFTDTIRGSSGSDSVRPFGGSDSVDGRDGIDAVDYGWVTTGAITVEGGADAPQQPLRVSVTGADFAHVVDNVERFRGTASNDLYDVDFAVGSGLPDDTIYMEPGAGNDTGIGGAEIDFFFVASGTKNVQLGGNNDLVVFLPFTGIRGTYDMGAGIDAADFSNVEIGGTLSFQNDVLRAVSEDGGNTFDTSFFVNESWRLNENWSFNLGVRYETPSSFSLDAGNYTGVLGNADDVIRFFELNTVVDLDGGGGVNTADFSEVADLLTFQFNLNNTVVFNDGESFDANVVNFTFYTVNQALFDGAGLTYPTVIETTLGDVSGTLGDFGDTVIGSDSANIDLDLGGGHNVVDLGNVGSGVNFNITRPSEIRLDASGVVDNGLEYGFEVHIDRDTQGEDSLQINGTTFGDSFQAFPFDPDLAQRLLEEAGFIGETTTVVGGAGSDTASGSVIIDYSLANGFTVAPGQGSGVFTVVDGLGGSDTLNNVLGVILAPSSTANFGATNIYVRPTGGSNSITMGPQGVVDYQAIDVSAVIDLGAGSAVIGDETDDLNGVNNVYTSPFSDRITGNDAGNFIAPGLGFNIVDGGLGADVYKIAAPEAGVTFQIFPTIPGKSFIAWYKYDSGSNAVELGALDDITSFETFDLDGQVLQPADLERPAPAGGVVTLPGGGSSTVLPDDPPVMASPPSGAAPPGLVDELGPGDDEIIGGNGPDTVFSGFGDDIVEGGGDRDFLVGGNGNDSLAGGDADDVLFGLAGDDFLVGEQGNDFLFSGAGADIMYGGADNDRLHVNADDVIAVGADGFFDVLVPQDNAGGVTQIDLGAADQNVGPSGPQLSGFEAVDASIATAAVSVTGTTFSVDFGSGPVTVGNVLFGSGFNDTLQGSSAADILLGNGSADILIGAEGDDTLIADSGADTLTGGAGSDDFFHPGGSHGIRVTDFAAGTDDIVLLASLGLDAAAALAATQQSGADAVLTLPGGGTVALVGVQVSALAADDFEIV